MNQFRRAYLVLAVAVSLPLLATALAGLYAPNPLWALPPIALFALLWLGFLGLRRKSPSAFRTTFAVVAILWGLAAFAILRRILYVLREGGLDRADSVGSPAVFLMNTLVEAFLFLVLSVVLLRGVVWIYRNRRQAVQLPREE